MIASVGFQSANFCVGLSVFDFGATLGSILNAVFVQGHGEEAQDALVTLHFYLEGSNDGSWSFELEEVIEPTLLFVDGVCQLAEAPLFDVDKFGTIRL